MLRVHPDVVKQLKAPGTKWLQESGRDGRQDYPRQIPIPSLHPEQFDIH